MVTNNFTAHLHRTQGKIGVSLRGSCTDTVAARQLEATIQAAIDNGLTLIWIDCQRLEPITWHGQRALLNADRQARLNGVTLCWCGMSTPVMEQLAASGLSLLLRLQPASSYQGPALLLQDSLPAATQSKFFYNT